ncbi:FMN-binding protein [Enterococcus sp. 669A]|uniref:FMN-binding protein n=1 Tax=Candidatus Enterococcus moelleringii TaxID=2815325 RepID=A0ABS3LAH7_9ENTE|nr:FMN-binding protein [Enterococcus sp. 669A]MBO1306638.1 FMN-binding protein [Enterococcus sp. 669A]
MSKLLIGLLTILILGFLIFFVADRYTKSVLKDAAVADIDLTEVSDGTYTGEAAIKPVIAKVEVTVESGKIADVQILAHQTGLGKKAEVITTDIVEKQSLDVDAVSGATMSSRAIVKAAENALTQE